MEKKHYTIAASFGVSNNTVGEWHRNKIKLPNFFTKTSSNAANRISMKIGQTPKINKAVYLWFYSHKTRGKPTSGPIIKEKAEILSENFQMKTKVSKLVKVGYIDGKLFTVSVN